MVTSAGNNQAGTTSVKPLEHLLDNIAAALMLLDAGDLPAVASLHDQFLNLHKVLLTEAPGLADSAQKCANVLEKIIMRDIPDVDAAVNALAGDVTTLQSAIRDCEYPQEKRADIAAPAAKATGEPEQSVPVVSQQAKSAPAAKDPAPQPAPAHKLTMSFANADASLVGEFINEARDHCLTAEQKMMDLETGVDYESAINAIFRSFHTIKGAAGFLEMHPVLALAHESETLLDMIRRGSMTIDGPVADLIFASIDGLRKLLAKAQDGLASGGEVDGSAVVTDLVASLRQLITNPGQIPTPPPVERVGDILVNMGVTSQKEIDSALTSRQAPEEKLGETLVKQGVVPAQSVAHALKVQKLSQREADTAPATQMKEMVKIDMERLDRMVDTIGELVIAESMVGHDDEFLAIAPPRMAKNVSHLNKITRELQEMGMSMRLVPVRATFQKLARAVRDLTRKSGKKVELITSGEDVEVDRSIIENIGDPLMHMIRNAVDHAIEVPEERVANGKAEVGCVWLRAYHRGGSIHFEIEDDGRGLDSERILAKAHEKGIIDHQRELTEREIYNLILLPGFSTAKKVTDISGRGVGMDVVKKNIEAMRGHLEIESKHKKGTRFTMRLPLTLAMIDGMLVRIAGERYIIPTMSVVESVNLHSERVFTIRGRQEMINLRGHMLPVLRLAQMFEMTTDTSCDRVVVVVEDAETRVGLLADELIGQRQTVIKSLGPVFARQKFISGGAILSDGTVGLILDVNGLISLAKSMGVDRFSGWSGHKEEIPLEDDGLAGTGAALTDAVVEELVPA
ncbi:MAG: chemotaxis protein CheA [candidate division Zixibacteria bacterium]|nr:chemotaxis protein CheA [candidate division Zixibacteria bacterium]